MQIYQHSREAHSILGFFPEFHGVCPRLKCRTLRLEIVGVYQIAPPMLTHVTQVWFDIVKLVQEEIIQVILLGPRGMFYLNDLLLLVFLRNTMKIGNIIPSISKKYAKKATGISQKYHENWKHYSKYF